MTARRHRSASLILGTALAAWAAGAGAGCGPAFDPYNRLESLRVLAIRSDPVAPASGETAMLSALVYPLPSPGQAAPDYTWSWCPFVGPSTGGYKCLVTDADIQAMTGQSITLELGNAPTASLPNNIDPAVLAALCAGMPGLAPPLDCSNGFPITIMLTVSDGTTEIAAIEPLDLRFPIDAQGDTQQGNNNPSMDAPTVSFDDGMTYAPFDPSAPLPRRKATPIAVTIHDDASESYMGLDDNGNPAQLDEQLALTWFVESGDTMSQNTVFINGVTTLSDAGKNQWTPAVKKDYQPDAADLIVVIRDGRNGVSWTTAVANLEPTP